MRHTIDIEHPAVTKLLVSIPREMVETLPVPANGCYAIEFGRVTVGGSVQDVLKASVREGADAERGGGRTELLLIQPTTGELSVASINHAETVRDRESREYACVKRIESATELRRHEGPDADDPVAAIARDVVPHGDATSIEGTLDILMALAHRGGVSRTVERTVRRSFQAIHRALDAQDHERRVKEIERTGSPEGPPRAVGLKALDDGVHTAMSTSRTMMDECHGYRMQEEPWTHQSERAAKEFRRMLGEGGLVTVDGGPARPIDEVALSYGGERSDHRQVMVDGTLMKGLPTYAHDVCVIRGADRAVTLRIAG